MTMFSELYLFSQHTVLDARFVSGTVWDSEDIEIKAQCVPA